MYSNLPIGDFAYPSWGFWGNKGVLLGFYGSGQIEDLVKKPIKDRIEHVLTHASKVHPQIRTEFEAAYCTFWEKTPYSLGAFATGGGGGGGEGARGEGAARGGGPRGAGARGEGARGEAAGARGSGLSNTARLEALGKPDNRIYLGCGAVSGNGGWQEGAVAAAWKQVKALHERVMSSRPAPASKSATA
jgi:monoamine oxidase